MRERKSLYGIFEDDCRCSIIQKIQKTLQLNKSIEQYKYTQLSFKDFSIYANGAFLLQPTLKTHKPHQIYFIRQRINRYHIKYEKSQCINNPLRFLQQFGYKKTFTQQIKQTVYMNIGFRISIHLNETKNFIEIRIDYSQQEKHNEVFKLIKDQLSMFVQQITLEQEGYLRPQIN